MAAIAAVALPILLDYWNSKRKSTHRRNTSISSSTPLLPTDEATTTISSQESVNQSSSTDGPVGASIVSSPTTQQTRKGARPISRADVPKYRRAASRNERLGPTVRSSHTADRTTRRARYRLHNGTSVAARHSPSDQLTGFDPSKAIGNDSGAPATAAVELPSLQSPSSKLLGQKKHCMAQNINTQPVILTKMLTGKQLRASKHGKVNAVGSKLRERRRRLRDDLTVYGKCKLKRHHPDCVSRYRLMHFYRNRNRWYQLQGGEDSAWLQEVRQEWVACTPSQCSYSQKTERLRRKKSAKRGLGHVRFEEAS